MLEYFTPVHVQIENRPQPPRPAPYGRWPAGSCPRPVSAAAVAAHNERRLVIWRRRSREMLVVYGHELNVTESGVKCVKPNADADDWYDWTYYAPQVGDVLGWEYVNRSESRFEVVGVCS